MRICAGFAANRVTTTMFSLSIAVAACGPVAPGEEPATTSGEPSTGAPPTGDAPPTTGTSGATTSSGSTSEGPVETTVPVMNTSTGVTSGTTEDTCGFLCPDEISPDTCGLNVGGPGDGLEWRCTLCDVFKQDCPGGTKCAAKAGDGGGSWNTTTCTPVTGDGAPGEACVAEDGLNGADDCRKGAMCWDVDKETLIGTCVELCTGTADSPMCSNEAEVHCAISNDGVLNLCLPVCDPLMQGCAGDDLCIPIGETFQFVLDASGEEGQTFDPCEFMNACDAGLLCLNPAAATECDPNVGGCCLPFCDLSAPNAACPGAGQSCVPFHEDVAPPEFMNVGVCSIPL